MFAAMLLAGVVSVGLMLGGLALVAMAVLAEANSPIPGKGGFRSVVVAGLVVAAFGAALLALTFWPSPADAHDAPAGWTYPFACCANYDCREVPADWVEERADGTYRIVATDERIPMTDRRVRNSPDGRFHWCAHQAGLDAGRTICLFVPPRSF
jgi:hypothetical protein